MYNSNSYKNFIKIGYGGTSITPSKMWQMNGVWPEKPFPNPLKKYGSSMDKYGWGGILSAVSPLANAIPGVGPVVAPILGAAGSIIESQENKKNQQGPPPVTTAMNTNPFGYALGGQLDQMHGQQQMQQVQGGGMNPISNQSFEVQGNPNQVDSETMNYKGKDVRLDNNEMVDTVRDMVFSDKLYDPRTGKSFASSAKTIEKRIHKADKPTVIDQRTKEHLEKQKESTFAMQEQLAKLLGQREEDGSTVQDGQAPGMATGGRMDGYAGGGDLAPYMYKLIKDAGKISSYPPRASSNVDWQDMPTSEYEDTKAAPWEYLAGKDKKKNPYDYRDLKGTMDEQLMQRAINEAVAGGEKIGDGASLTDGKFGPGYAAAVQNEKVRKIYQDHLKKKNFQQANFMGNAQAYELDKLASYQNDFPTYEERKKQAEEDAANNPKDPTGPFEVDDMKGGRSTPAPKSKYDKGAVTGDYIQAGALGAQGLWSIFDKPEKQRLYQNTAPITQSKFDPSRALLENQYSANAAQSNIGNTYSSAAAQAGYQNLAANKMRQDGAITTQYDNMNEEARTNYEQRLAQRMSENNQSRLQTDDINMANRAKYRDGIRNSIESVANFGSAMSQRSTQLKGYELVGKTDPKINTFIQNDLGNVTNPAYNPFTDPLLMGDQFNKKVTTPPGGWSGGSLKRKKKN